MKRVFSSLMLCPSCRHPTSPDRIPLCDACAAALKPATPLCPHCGSPDCLISGPNPGTCRRPWFETSNLITGFTAGALLTDSVYGVLLAWKNRKAPLLTQRILKELRLKETLEGLGRREKFDFVTFVPQSHQRGWQLFGSTSATLAKMAAEALHVPLVAMLDVDRRRQAKSTPRQAQRSLLERTNSDNPFCLTAHHRLRMIQHRRILLVDDFMTTGKTIKLAAQALQPLHPSSIQVFVLGLRPPRFEQERRESA